MSRPPTTTGPPPVLLRPLARLFSAAVRMRNRRYDLWPPAPCPIPVISVGNLAAGGTGKTPIVEWISRRLLAIGRRPAIVSRGYGGSARRGPVVVSLGEGPRVPASRCGDEPWLLASKLPRVVVVVGSNRLAGIAEAARVGCDAVILDDGFQHRRVARDLDLVLLDSREPLGNGWLLPAGLLREPPTSLARADAVLLTRWRADGSAARAEALARTHGSRSAIVRVRFLRSGFVDALFEPAPRPERAVAFCGIGNPHAFREDLEAEGVRLIRFDVRPDHHRYGEEELGLLYALARRCQAPLLTTEKDLARLDESWRRAFGGDLRALRIEAAPVDAELLERLVAGSLRAEAA